jgi:hypothetical protein
LQRRGYQAIHGDRELRYQGDPESGTPMDDRVHSPLWDVERVKAFVASQDEPVTFFCGGTSNLAQFVELLDGVFVLEVDLDTCLRRVDERVARDPTDWGGKPAERELIARLHHTKEDLPKDGVIIDATPPLALVADEILRLSAAQNTR